MFRDENDNTAQAGVLDNAQSDELRVLSACFETLEHSFTACSLMDEAALNDWTVTLCDLDDAQDYHIDMLDRIIYVNIDGLSPAAVARSPYFQTYILSVLARSLRDIAQEQSLPDMDYTYTPEAILFISRMRAADLHVINALIAWELREAGFPLLWRHLIGTEDGDIAMRFSSAFEQNNDNRNAALMAAFDQWYNHDCRVDAADHDCLNFLDAIITEECGDNARGGVNPFGVQNIDIRTVERISCLPDRSAYLNGQGADMLRDPYYAGLGDDVNQTHFMQIMDDMTTVTVNNVPFRSSTLAARIFPDGLMSEE